MKENEKTKREKKKRDKKRESKVSRRRELPNPELFKEMLLKDDWAEHYLHRQIVVPERGVDDDGKKFWYNVECRIYNDDERYQKRGLVSIKIFLISYFLFIY